MRTDLDIDDDVLRAATEIAERDQISAGQALSELARESLSKEVRYSTVRNGVPILPARPGASTVDLDVVNRLRNETF